MTQKRSNLSSHCLWLIDFDAPVVTPIPVFRCEYCRHWAQGVFQVSGDPDYNYCYKIRKVTKNDFFCGYGELKEGSEEE